MIESEVKVRVADAAAARSELASLGATCVRPRCFEDNLLLDDAAGSLRVAGSSLRLRRTAGQASLTFKGPCLPDASVKSREEIEASVADAETVQEILLRLGLRPVFRYQKYRETWAWKDVEIVVDETPIGNFLEIEGTLQGIQAAAAALGRDAGELLTASYAGLFRAAGGQGDMVFHTGG